MTKVFNVDSIKKEKRTLVIDGKEHEVVKMSVDAFLATLEEAETLEKKGDKVSLADQINTLVRTITRAIPTLPESEIRALDLETMRNISQFVNGEIPDALKEAVEGQGQEGGEAKNA